MLNDDLAIAIAIVAHRGDVPLLLPVIRAQCQGLDLLQTFAAVQNIAQDRRYAAAFSQERGEDRSPRLSTPQPACEAPRGLYDRFVDWFNGWILSRAFPPPPPSPISEIVDPGATSEPESLPGRNLPEANVLGGNRQAGSNGCGVCVELVVTCKDGILVDSVGCARGVCPYCLGK